MVSQLKPVSDEKIKPLSVAANTVSPLKAKFQAKSSYTETQRRSKINDESGSNTGTTAPAAIPLVSPLPTGRHEAQTMAGSAPRY